ncbi:MFS transporter [Novosphingobium lindaniclasticum]|uniref:MFS transporter n=1 Tax=Novosphingobium lindaniclasticum TaxID=1329895 RepID=UPI001F3AC5E7|nr:MFS transporter [Novosphingobium lindaniclasticum]
MLSTQQQSAGSSASHRHIAGEARLLGYASGNFGKNLVFAGADLTVLYLLTDLFGLPGAVAGLLMLVALAGDLVFDLLAALLVIRLRRAGRGYRWLIMAGAVPGGAGFALLYALPALGAERLWMVAGALLLFRGAYAVIDVPHNALMARVTVDSRARGRVSGYRLFFSTMSSLTVASLLTPVVQQAVAARAVEMLALTGCAAGLLFAMTMAFSALASGREDRNNTDGKAERDGESDGIAVPVRDGLVLGMGLLALITGFAVPTFERMLLYMGTYVFHRPETVSSLLVAVTFGQFLGVLLWTTLTNRHDKSSLLAAGHMLCVGSLTLFLLCMAWPPALLACAVLSGMGFTCVFMLPWGLLADAVDFVAWKHERRFETGLFAFYLVAVKASGAAATGLIGWSLGQLGYVPGAAQSAVVRGGILALGIGVPIAGSLAAIALLRRFRIGHARHARVLSALAEGRKRIRHAGLATAAPVSARPAPERSPSRDRKPDWQDRAARARGARA